MLELPASFPEEDGPVSLERDDAVCVKAGGVCVMDGGVCESEGGVCVKAGGVCESEGGVCESEGGVCVKAGGVCESEGGVCESEGGVCVKAGGVCESEGGVCESEGGVCVKAGAVCVMDGGVCDSEGGVCVKAGGVCTRVGLADCSDEVLLTILRHVPSHDLLLRVAPVCRRLHALTRDKSLISHISLSAQYTVDDDSVRCVLRSVRWAVTSLDLGGCYWLSSGTVGEAWRCAGLQRLDVSGCRVPIGRLSRVLAGTGQLRELALDVGRGLDPQVLCADARRTLSGLSALTQTLLVPSYGVLPLCPALTRLELQLEVGGACEGVELAVGQSSVPHYQNLTCLSARLGPGPANQTLLALLLAPLSVRPITRLTRLLLSAPGPAPPRPPALASLLESFGAGLAQGGGTFSTALQLPGSWLDGAALGCVLSRGCPAYVSLARGCPAPCLPDYDLRPLTGLNLSGCGGTLDSDWLRALCESCPLLRHLNLSGLHYHHGDRGGGASEETHPCSVLARLSRLQTLALSVCVLAEAPAHTHTHTLTHTHTHTHTSSLLHGLRRAPRVGVATYRPGSEVAEQAVGVACLRRMLIGCTQLRELELVGAEFCSATPRYEPANRKQAVACAWAGRVGEVAVATLGCRPSLTALTLAGWPGFQSGRGLNQLTQHCPHLTSLSLAGLGNTHTHTHALSYTHALLQALPHCQRLRDLRVEQAYFELSEAVCEALWACVCLERLCVVARNGTFSAVAVTTLMCRCTRLVMCHLLTGATLNACRSLQHTLTHR
ncbi:hypothetical protein ACEWY4_017508 [Coilia grayii]|uniref:F-box domain-containing protein n=1 Tax=Coilia grayii TaxID=363190 RepID=A0ABD1JH27_9TELE